MKYSFSENALRLYESQFLFSSQEYVFLTASSKPYSFRFQDEQNDLFFHCQIEGRNAVSFRQSPFGGLDTRMHTFAGVKSFYKEIFGQLKQLGVSNLTIKLPPEVYDSELCEMQETILSELRPTEVIGDSNYHIPVSKIPFNKVIHHNQKHKLSLAIKAGLTCRKLELNETESAYDLIFSCLSSKGYPMTMGKDQVLLMLEELPDFYSFYGVFDGVKIVATSLVVKVNSRIVYTSYNGDDENYRKMSPLVYLHEYIYTQLRDDQVEMIDLGIASVSGQINRGLATFKEHLGGQLSRKLAFQFTF